MTRAQRDGKPVFVWTVNEQIYGRCLLDANIDAVMTDHVETLRVNLHEELDLRRKDSSRRHVLSLWRWLFLLLINFLLRIVSWRIGLS